MGRLTKKRGVKPVELHQRPADAPQPPATDHAAPSTAGVSGGVGDDQAGDQADDQAGDQADDAGDGLADRSTGRLPPPDDWRPALAYLATVAEVFPDFRTLAVTFPPPPHRHAIDPDDEHRERPPLGAKEVIHASRVTRTRETLGGHEKRYRPLCVSWVKTGARLPWGWYQ